MQSISVNRTKAQFRRRASSVQNYKFMARGADFQVGKGG